MMLLDKISYFDGYKNQLTAIVLMALWRAAKKNGLGRRQIAYQLKQGKCYELKQSILLIESIKYGLSTCLFVKKDN